MTPPLPPDAIAARVRAAFPATELRASDNHQPWLHVPADDLLALSRFLRDDRDLSFDQLLDLTGYDLLKYPVTPPSDAIAVVYLLHSLGHRHKLTLKVLAPRSACVVPSVSSVWPAALYFEREVWDLLGVDFPGHPSLLRIMCPQDWVGHPLRKDYLYPADYHGVPHVREGQKFEGGPKREGDPSPEAKGSAPKVAEAAAAQPKTTQAEAIGPNATGTKATGTGATGTNATGTKANGTKANGTQATGTKATGA